MNFSLSATRPRHRTWALRLALCSALACGASHSVGAAQTSVSDKHITSTLTAEEFYGILLGELHVRRGDLPTGFSILFSAARQTNDAQLYNRAVEVALQARSGDGALSAARAWAKAWPQDLKAHTQWLKIVLVLNQVQDSLEPLTQELALMSAAQREVRISQLPTLFGSVSDKKKALAIVQQAITPYLGKSKTTDANIWTTLGYLRQASGDKAAALEALQKAQATDAKTPAPMLLGLSLMEQGVQEAEALVVQRLRQAPDSEVSLRYARVLIVLERYVEANQELQHITRIAPELADAWLILGLLQFEQTQYAQADASLARYVSLERQKTTGLNVPGLTQAQTRRATLKAREGKLDDALQLLEQLPARNDQELRSRLMAQVQLLRDARQWRAAFDLLAAYSEGDNDLMYEQAMLAEKFDDIATMERLLRAVIAQDPKYHSAYNALGFSFAERNIKLNEAKALIEKALSLVPDDPFILDSLAWVEFRLGRADVALTILQKAFTARPDAEIAAHWGEVLWSVKRVPEAIEVWRKGLALSPDNETLQETLRRLKPEL